jgi:hypothetical protein
MSTREPSYQARAGVLAVRDAEITRLRELLDRIAAYVREHTGPESRDGQAILALIEGAVRLPGDAAVVSRADLRMLLTAVDCYAPDPVPADIQGLKDRVSVIAGT